MPVSSAAAADAPNRRRVRAAARAGAEPRGRARRRPGRIARGRRVSAGVVALVAFTLGVLSGAVLDPRSPREAPGYAAGEDTDDQASSSTTSTPAAGAPLGELRPDAATSRMQQRLALPEPTGGAAEPVPGAGEPVWAARAVPAGLTAADVRDGLLGAEVPAAGSGTRTVVPGSAPAASVGESPTKVLTVRVEVEDGLAVDGAVFADRVMGILTAPGGWTTPGELAFAWTDGPADITVVLASPAMTDALCAPLRTRGEYSCGRDGRAVLNMLRWVQGQGQGEFEDLSAYREYLVNHEVGHLLGHRHRQCSAPGALAPLMKQQSYSSAPCVPNGWPYPESR